jgi:hypothetical protein
MGRTGFGSGQVGRGAGRTTRQGMVWFRQDWQQQQGGEEGFQQQGHGDAG